MSDLVFQKVPNKPWWSLLFSKRKGETLPLLRAEWQGAESWDLSAYQELCGFNVSETLPITYPQILATPLHFQLLAHPAFPFSVLGLVHVAQKIEQKRALLAHERPDILTWCDGLRQVRRGMEFSIHTEARIGDEVIWKAESITFTRARKGHGQKSQLEEPSIDVLQDELTLTIPENLGRRYCGISGDWNPIHINMILAKLFGFPRAIIHGMWSMARCIAALPEEPKRVEAQFRRPVFLPSTAQLRRGVSGDRQLIELVRPKDGKRHLWIDVWT